MGVTHKTDDDDQIIRLIGNFGLWQALLICPLFVHFVFGSWQTLVTSFLSLERGYWCDIQAPDNVFGSLEEWENFSSPILENGKLDKCNIYDLDYTLLSQVSVQSSEVSAEAFLGDVKTKPCPSFKFDLSTFESSIVTDFGLVCGRDWLVTTAQVVYMFGFLTGALVSGMVSDRFGRKKTIIVSSILMSIFSVATAFSSSIEVFIFLRWCVAFTSIAFWTTVYVYSMEMVGHNWKTWIGIGFEFPWALAYTVLPGVAYNVRNWANLQLVISVPPIVLIIVYFFLPESPRWLLANGKVEEAKVILEKAAKRNGRTWPKDFHLVSTSKAHLEVDTDEPKASVIDLFRTPNLRKNTLIQYFNWFTASFVYYGLTFDSGTIVPGNIYINFLVGGIIEFPAYMLCLVILYFIGRRLPLAFMYFLGGVALLLTLAMPAGQAVLGMASLGKFGIICAFAIIYVHAAELFPTVVRNTGLGSSSSFARIGSMLAPVIGRELGRVDRNLTIIIFAACSLIAGCLTLFLPETKNQKLPDSIEEGEEFGSDDSVFDMCKRKQTTEVPQNGVGMDNMAYNNTTDVS